MQEVDFVILGAGVTGLAAAGILGSRAVVLERESRPGGLVRTEHHDGFWFDHVLHMLHFSDEAMERQIRHLIGPVLAPCPPTAWVETAGGVTRYPFQMHLAGLDRDARLRCLTDFWHASRGLAITPRNLEEYLIQTFGRGMCDVFLFPYNRKTWKRDLRELDPNGFTWTIPPPDAEAIIRGALDDDADYRAYNANGWYPRPPAGAPCRGMEVLSRAMAERVPNLCLDHEVVSIDLPSQTVTARHNGSVRSFRFRKGCAATLPLPSVIAMCSDAPPSLKAACAALPRMRVICVMIGIKGPRPSNRGHWRYYADETISFNRLVYLHEFDPSSAPSDGWGMLAEITQRAELPFTDERELWRLVERDLRRVGAIPPECRVSLARQHVIDPAYVVFEKGTETTIEAARAHLSRGGATPLGRYGRWEYSSIERNLRDGFHWAAMHADDPVDGGLVRHLG